MTESRSAVNRGIPATDRAVQGSKDKNGRAGLAIFRNREVTRVRANVSDDATWGASAPAGSLGAGGIVTNSGTC